VKLCQEPWAKALRGQASRRGGVDAEEDVAFSGPHTLLNSDQGIRGLLYATNDLCFVSADKLGLADWRSDRLAGATDQTDVSDALETLKDEPVDTLLRKIAQRLATFDWRTSSAPGLDVDESIRKGGLRGSGGYKLLRALLLKHLALAPGDVGEAATHALRELGYE
jgi:hypothetical protein